jgi:hypothetical protein
LRAVSEDTAAEEVDEEGVDPPQDSQPQSKSKAIKLIKDDETLADCFAFAGPLPEVGVGLFPVCCFQSRIVTIVQG